MNKEKQKSIHSSCVSAQTGHGKPYWMRLMYPFFSATVGLSMMCYTFGKEERTAKGDIQLSGRIGKLLYWRCLTASCFLKSSKE